VTDPGGGIRDPDCLRTGPIELLDAPAASPAATDLLAALRATLSDVARLAGPTQVHIAVAVDQGIVLAEVTNDGAAPDGKGTARRWQVPIPVRATS
jgi:hypothetical protein